MTVSTETPETTIYYTLDGEEPGQAGTRFITGLVYKGPIEISRTTCLRAIARRDGWKSSPIGGETMDLNLVRFTDGIDFVFPSFELAPGAYCLVVDDKSVFEAYYGPGLPIAGQYAGNLANGGETIELVDAMGTTIQRFAYEDDWYAETDGGGYSLTMVDVTEPDLAVWSQKEAWQASNIVDGSPGTGFLP